ncbi:hypothetical protein [Paraburkholderia piptadeniae]|nr:hypothetical protein [Paraburkholderia piptadeniae]
MRASDPGVGWFHAENPCELIVDRTKFRVFPMLLFLARHIMLSMALHAFYPQFVQ